MGKLPLRSNPRRTRCLRTRLEKPWPRPKPIPSNGKYHHYTIFYNMTWPKDRRNTVVYLYYTVSSVPSQVIIVYTNVSNNIRRYICNSSGFQSFLLEYLLLFIFCFFSQQYIVTFYQI